MRAKVKMQTSSQQAGFLGRPYGLAIPAQINFQRSSLSQYFPFCLVSGVRIIVPQRRVFDMHLENIQILGKSHAKAED